MTKGKLHGDLKSGLKNRLLHLAKGFYHNRAVFSTTLGTVITMGIMIPYVNKHMEEMEEFFGAYEKAILKHGDMDGSGTISDDEYFSFRDEVLGSRGAYFNMERFKAYYQSHPERRSVPEGKELRWLREYTEEIESGRRVYISPLEEIALVAKDIQRQIDSYNYNPNLVRFAFCREERPMLECVREYLNKSGIRKRGENKKRG